MNNAMKVTRLMFVLYLLMFMVGCATGPASPDHPTVEHLASLAYPSDASYGDNLDLIAIKEGFNLRLVNRTPNVYRDLQLWLNQQYVHEVSRIEIGENNLYHLDTFINKHKESFPLGGFFTPEKAMPIILAELYEPYAKQRFRLVVQPNKP